MEGHGIPLRLFDAETKEQLSFVNHPSSHTATLEGLTACPHTPHVAVAAVLPSSILDLLRRLLSTDVALMLEVSL